MEHIDIVDGSLALALSADRLSEPEIRLRQAKFSEFLTHPAQVDNIGYISIMETSLGLVDSTP